MSPLVLFGGTFDPVHIGHLRVAWEASEILQAPVHIMPARIPPHRSSPMAGAAERVAILEAALAGQDRLRMDLRELGRDGPSYTVDTLRDLRREYGSAKPLVLLVGADAFAGLDRWHAWRDLFELAHLGILSRPGQSPPWPRVLTDAVDGRLVSPDALSGSAAGRVARIDVTPLDISASRVRELIAEGRSPRYLLPESVLARPDLLACYTQRTGG